MATPTKRTPEAKAANAVDLGYDPQDMDMKHDSFFSAVAPGVVKSGNLAHKYGAEGDHSVSESMVEGLKGD